jgi:imidazolonepropionase-like amidohydrolase
MSYQLLRAERILIGPPGDQIRHGEVLIDGATIARVGPQGTFPADDAVTVREFGDATILPGLIDCHVHVGFDGPSPAGHARTPAADHRLLLRMAENCRKLVAAGVTTARDLGCRSFLDVLLRDAIEDGLVVGPHLVVATRPITVTGGHCWFIGDEADTPDAIRLVARENLRAGADCLKVMVTGGAMTPNGPPMWAAQYTVTDLRVVVEEAAARGKHVAAHAPGSAGIRVAAEAGVHTIEHCSFRTTGDVRSGGVEADVLATMLEHDISVCPTFAGAFRRYAASLGDGTLEDILGRVAAIRQAGVRIIAGTDSGFFLRGLPNRADDYVSGLEMLREAGLANTEVIASATAHAADGLGLASVTGRLAAGLRGDVIVVDGDPTKDLAALRKLRLVLVSGRRVTQGPSTRSALHSPRRTRCSAPKTSDAVRWSVSRILDSSLGC